MRWSRLFDDLEAQAVAAEEAELAEEIADRIRLEVARVSLEDRLRGAVGGRLEVHAAGGHQVAGQVLDVGAGWLLITAARGVVLVRTESIVDLTGLGIAVGPPWSDLEQRLDLNHSLRALARDRALVRVALADGRTLSGVIDRVGADFVDLTELDGECRRRRTVRTTMVCVIRTGCD